MSIRVVLGEDNVLVREGVRALLDSYDDIEVVGVAVDAPSLLATAAEHVPDVVVTDIKMPPSFQLEGIDCAHAIRSSHPDTGVVVLSAHDDEAYALALLGRGHSGLAYLLKDRISQGDELARAIREVHAGGSTVDPVIAERLSGTDDTADRERELLDMMAKGMGYTEIAAALGTTEEAVDSQVTGLFRRMAGDGAGSGMRRRVQAAARRRRRADRVAQDARRRSCRNSWPTDWPRTRRSAIEPQEVEVSVLFSDIRGFSTIAERLPARDVAAVVGKHLSAMAEVVLELGGMIDKFQGDAVMAVFGAPEPTPDHAERALICAIAMQARQSELNVEGWDADVDQLHVGIGVNTGSVIAGTVGGGGRLEYTVVGDAVNIAQRLQSEAEGGEVVASASTIAAAPAIACVSIGARHVKGREEPVEVFRVVIG